MATSDSGWPTYRIDAASSASGILVDDLETPVANSNFTFSITNSLDVNGDTLIRIYSDEIKPSYDEATHAFYLSGSTAQVHLNGNVEIVNQHATDISSVYGANTLYLTRNAGISLGTEDSLTRIFSIASIPDAISAKYGSTVEFVSTHNQVVGTIDLSSSSKNPDYDGTSRVTGTFSGPDSFWFGDEASSLNTSEENRKEQPGVLDLTFENGAQWSYLNVADTKSVPKRISAITLNNGGIINLFDEDIENFLKSVGLYDQLNDGNYILDHDYVRIGDLKGSGGIFRLGLDGRDKTSSDMVFIENSTTGGQHFFEPNDLVKLEPITPENTLVFALVGKEAKDKISFADKENLEGETLYDYELEIAHETTTEETLQKEELDAEFLSEDGQSEIYLGGEAWYIRRVTLTESTAARAMTGAGYAAYDAAVEMDRRDRRLAESLHNTDAGNGLWVRATHGRSGIDGQYRWERSGVVIGFDRRLGEMNTFGAWFSYTKGDADFLDINGTGELTRYEFALYDTLAFGEGYLDLVGRIGRVSAEFDAASAAYRTTGDFDQDYAALSAEIGWTFIDQGTGLFVEPQVQMQAAWLKSYDYDSERGMQVQADSGTSVLGRAGFRAGRRLSGKAAAGEVYLRADLMHQFTDGQDATLRDTDGHVVQTNWGDRGTWGLAGFGGAVSWGGSYGLQLDIERAFGGEVENTWLITGRFKYLF